MKLKFLAIAVSLTLVAVWVAPIVAADKEQRQMMADIRMLQEQAQLLQNTVQTMSAALADAIKLVDTRVTAKQDEQADATRKALADQRTVISSISSDLRSVREKMDDNTTRLGSLALEVQALRQLVTSSRATLSSGAGPGDTSTADAAQPTTDSSVLGASPQKLFESAFGDYTAGQWDLAIEGFNAFIKSAPGTPQADRAQVYICNAYLTDGKYQQAVEACELAIRNYPNGPFTPEAYYRKGLAHKGLKQTDLARAAFDYVVKTFPDSGEATLASQNLP